MPLASIGAIAPASAPSQALPATGAGRSFGALLEERAARSAPLTVTPPTGLSNAALHGLQSIERAQARLDGLLAQARTGRTFTAQELLALQGEAYRYSQAVELSAKLVEQGAQGVKQALHAQV